jgi:hypothetical protein
MYDVVMNYPPSINLIRKVLALPPTSVGAPIRSILECMAQVPNKDRTVVPEMKQIAVLSNGQMAGQPTLGNWFSINDNNGPILHNDLLVLLMTREFTIHFSNDEKAHLLLLIKDINRI